MKKHNGFTLLELMMVVAIIGILAAIALPSYAAYKRSSNRTAIKADLSLLVTLLERRFTENGFYSTTRAGGTCIALNTAPYFNVGPSASRTKVYTITFQGTCTNSTYTLRATPTTGTSQVGDGFLEVTSTGVKRWDKNNSGTIDAGESDW